MYTRKDRLILFSNPGTKQRYKHSDGRHAKWEARDERRRATLLARFAASTADAPAQMTALTQLGGAVPMTGSGTVVLPDGRELAWTFRYRYDRAFLEVGTVDDWGLVADCALAASWDDVMGEPYQGWLTDAEAVTVLDRLFHELAAPDAGERFGERMANTLDLALGRGGDPDAPTLIRYIPAD